MVRCVSQGVLCDTSGEAYWEGHQRSEAEARTVAWYADIPAEGF
jgi:hypothetical protein